MSSPAHATVAKAIQMGYRQFLTHVHPDFFLNYPTAQKTNTQLIKYLNKPVDLLIESWSSDHRTWQLSPKPTDIEFYLDGNKNPHKYQLAFSETVAPIQFTKEVQSKATLSIVRLFSLITGSIDSDVLRYLEMKANMLHQDGDIDNGPKFIELLEKDSREADTVSFDVMARYLSSKDYIVIDGVLSVKEKMQALLSLFACRRILDRMEEDCGADIPILFVSQSDPIKSPGSIMLPPIFSPAGTLRHEFYDNDMV